MPKRISIPTIKGAGFSETVNDRREREHNRRRLSSSRHVTYDSVICPCVQCHNLRVSSSAGVVRGDDVQFQSMEQRTLLRHIEQHGVHIDLQVDFDDVLDNVIANHLMMDSNSSDDDNNDDSEDDNVHDMVQIALYTVTNCNLYDVVQFLIIYCNL